MIRVKHLVVALGTSALLIGIPSGSAGATPHTSDSAVSNNTAHLQKRFKAAHPGAVIRNDVRRGTPRLLIRQGRYLTKPHRTRTARRTALDFMAHNAGVLGVSRKTIQALRLVRRYTDDKGVTHLKWQQTFAGIDVYGAVVGERD